MKFNTVVTYILGCCVAIILGTFMFYDTKPPIYEPVEDTNIDQQQFFKDIEEIHQKRSKLLQEKCRLYNLSQDYPNPRQVVLFKAMSNNTPVWSCPVPKVATRFLARMFAISSNYFNVQNMSFLGPLNITGALSKAKFLQRYKAKDSVDLMKYHRILFVRHPFERLISAYLDKVYGVGQWRWTGIEIIKTVRQNPSNYSLACGHDLTFLEFLKYVLMTPDNTNRHWTSVMSYCQPCAVHYDIIGHTETAEDDIPYMSHIIGSNVPPLSNDIINIENIKREVQKLFMTRFRVSRNCNITFSEGYYRVWDVLKLHSYIDRNARIPPPHEILQDLTHLSLGIDQKLRLQLQSFFNNIQDKMEQAAIELYLRKSDEKPFDLKKYYFADIPNSLVEELRERFKLDFEMFEYT